MKQYMLDLPRIHKGAINNRVQLMLKFSILETGRLERYLNIDLKTIKSTKMMEPITHG